MSKDITIRKGLNIRLNGAAEETISKAPRSKTFAIRPADFHLILPRMAIKEGAKVKVGDVIFYSRSNEDMKFVAPFSGTLTAIERGARRVITRLVFDVDEQDEYVDFGSLDVKNASVDQIKEKWLASGCWPFIMQRPYDIIANPDTSPRDIFISGFTSAPLANNYSFSLQGKEKEIQAAIDALAKFTTGKIHVGVEKGKSSVFDSINGIEKTSVSGPHPAGNVGTQINYIAPVNKGEIVWTVSAPDLVIMGELLLTGKFNAERTIVLAGSSVKAPKYYKTRIGAEMSTFVYDAGLNEEHVRVVSGDVLTGVKAALDGHLNYRATTVTVIPEGDDYELFGWTKPVFNKISMSRALTFSWLNPNKKYDLNTNTNGEHRAFVVTGTYEKVFPLDMFPMQMLKACMVGDLDDMEALGMYEVAPEDFALTEFVCVSKQPHQEIIRKGLDLMIKEIG